MTTQVQMTTEALGVTMARFLAVVRERDDARAIAVDLEQQLAAAESVIEADTTQPNGGTA